MELTFITPNQESLKVNGTHETDAPSTQVPFHTESGADRLVKPLSRRDRETQRGEPSEK